jgi:hypothetical protein
MDYCTDRLGVGMFKVMALTTDQFLDEGSYYPAEWLDENDTKRVRVYFNFNGATHTCIRLMDVQVLDLWRAKNPDPWNFGV